MLAISILPILLQLYHTPSKWAIPLLLKGVKAHVLNHNVCKGKVQNSCPSGADIITSGAPKKHLLKPGHLSRKQKD